MRLLRPERHWGRNLIIRLQVWHQICSLSAPSLYALCCILLGACIGMILASLSLRYELYKSPTGHTFGAMNFDSFQAASSLARIDDVLGDDPDCIDSEAYYRLYLDGYSAGELEPNKRLVSLSSDAVHPVDGIRYGGDSG